MNKLYLLVEKYVKKANSPKSKMPHTTRKYYLTAADNLRVFINAQ